MTAIRRLLNRGRDLLFLPFMDSHWRSQLRGKVMCLLYHRVALPGQFGFLDAFAAPAIAPESLCADLQFLIDGGARFMTFADLRQGKFPADSEFGVIVSFDDGFRDNYTTGLDVLDRLGIPAVLFQSTALVDAPTLIWEHALYWYWHDKAMAQALTRLAHQGLPGTRELIGNSLLDHLRFQAPALSVDALLLEMREQSGCHEQLESLARALYPTRSHLRCAVERGHEVGSHGHHHYIRTGMDEALFENELRESGELLLQATGTRPQAFSFPFNSYMRGDMALCARYFQQTATVDGAFIERDTPAHALPRFSWPGPPRNALRRRRWLLTGRI